MGIWESALILLGIGIVSERFGAGVGLGELGTGIRTLAAAPLGGIGAGLGEFGGGLRTFAEALGDVGRGFGELFKNIPSLPSPFLTPPLLPGVTPPVNGNGLMTVSGGDQTGLLPGGGGNVPIPMPVIMPVMGPGLVGLNGPRMPPDNPTVLAPTGGSPGGGGGGGRYLLV